MAGATLQDLFTGNGVTTVHRFRLSSSNPTQLAAGPVFPAYSHRRSRWRNGSSHFHHSVRRAQLPTPYSEQGNLGVERDLDPRPCDHRLRFLEPRNPFLQRSRPEPAHDHNYLHATQSTTPTETRGRGHVYDAGLLGLAESAARGPTRPLAGSTRTETASPVSMTGSPCRFKAVFPRIPWQIFPTPGPTNSTTARATGKPPKHLPEQRQRLARSTATYRADYGNGLEDQPQRFVLSWVWTPTITHRDGAFYKYVVNNWQLSSITTINSSRPYGSPTINVSDTAVAGYVQQLLDQWLPA